MRRRRHLGSLLSELSFVVSEDSIDFERSVIVSQTRDMTLLSFGVDYACSKSFFFFCSIILVDFPLFDPSQIHSFPTLS